MKKQLAEFLRVLSTITIVLMKENSFVVSFVNKETRRASFEPREMHVWC